MFAYKFVYATMLLTTSPDLPELPQAPQYHPWLGSAVQAVAMSWELLDPRETRVIGYAGDDFAADLKVLQGRCREFAGAPALEECARFPDRPMINDLMLFNKTYRTELSARLFVDRVHAEDLQAALLETDQLYRVWELLRDARCDNYYTTIRRQALMQLRELVGAEAFYSGRLPPAVPVWRFPEN